MHIMEEKQFATLPLFVSMVCRFGPLIMCVFVMLDPLILRVFVILIT